MPDLSIHAAMARLHAGFLGERHREVLAGLLAAVGRAADENEVLPTYINVAFLVAVDVLGTEPAGGDVR